MPLIQPFDCLTKRSETLPSFFFDPRHQYPNFEFLMEFNPSIVLLPNHSRPTSDAVYLVAYRLSNDHHWCFPCDDEGGSLDRERVFNDPLEPKAGGPPGRPIGRDYLGLATLDIHLQIVQETVIDVLPYLCRFVDPRLQVLDADEQLYIHSYSRITRLSLLAPLSTAEQANMVPIPPIWPDRSTLPVWLRTFSSCTADQSTRRRAKNLGFFYDPARQQNIMEISVMGQKEVMNFSVPCDDEAATKANFLPTMRQSSWALSTSLSFGTTLELWLAAQGIYDPPLTPPRGSACCVDVYKDGERYLLGLAHYKIRYRKSTTNAGNHLESGHYLSIFYALNTTYPYVGVAQSAVFCLGFAQPTDQGYTVQDERLARPHLKIGEWYPTCPRVHYPAGMVQSADDPDAILVTYGINDCQARLVQIGKQDVVNMLWPPSDIADRSS